MKAPDTLSNKTTKDWKLPGIWISHSVIEDPSLGKTIAKNDSEYVRLHFGLRGSYEVCFNQLKRTYDLSGHHNNILYSDGLELEIQNKSEQIETFGINFSTNTFVEIAQNGNEPLKRFADKVLQKENALLSNDWKTNTFQIQQVISEIIHCTFSDELRELFLLSKSIELLVLQAELYGRQAEESSIKLARDRQRLIEAKELLAGRIEDPPTIVELAKLVGINEYKLKKGFKELFGTTIFGYIHQSRMSLAKKLLLGTDKSAKEIAYETGYSSPQHFSTAFKKEFGFSPKSVRNYPDSAPR